MEEGMKKEEKNVCFIVTMVICIVMIVGLDVTAGFVGLQAEKSQQNVKHHRVWLIECKAPSKTAFDLGVVALSCLVAAHVIANVIGCCVSNLIKVSVKPTIARYINLACLCLTWIVGIVGGTILLMGVWSNRESRSKYGFTNRNLLSLGGKVCFLHAFVSVVYYISSIVADSG